MSIVINSSLVVSGIAGESKFSPWIGWNDQVTRGGLTATSEEDLYPVTNLANPATSVMWVSASTGTQYVTVDNLQGGINYVGIARHNFGTDGMTVSIEAMTAESSPAFVEVVEPVVITSDSPLMFRFENDAYLSVRVKIVPVSIAPQAGVLFVGALLVPPVGIEPGYTPIRDGQQISMSVGRSESGEYLGSIVTNAGLQATTNLRRIPRSWFEPNMRPFVDAANRGDTFFFAWSPVIRPNDVGYCWFSESVNPQISTAQSHYDVGLNMGGIAL